MTALSERLERAARTSDRRIAAALACATASVRAARARLGCDLLLLADVSVASDAPVVEIGGLRIDRDCRTVTRAGEAVRLTPTLFDLLSLLASEPSKVFRKSEIYRAVRHSEHLPRNASRTVDSHLGRLRSALGGAPWVHTHWGVGVSLLPPGIGLTAEGARTAA